MADESDTTGRAARILAVPHGPTSGSEQFPTDRTIVLDWDYNNFGKNETIARLHRRAARPSWQPGDLPWDRPDPGPDARFHVARDLSRIHPRSAQGRFNAGNWQDWDERVHRYLLAQVLHAEQLAMLCGAALVESADDWDVKAFATAQTADEMRHVEVFHRYTAELGEIYPVNGHLRALFLDALSSKEWDMIYIAAQVMAEGMALSLFGILKSSTTDPLLDMLLRNVIADEARHVAFGATALTDVLSELSSVELRHRQEFVLEAAMAIRDRLIPTLVAQEVGLDTERFVAETTMAPSNRVFEARLFCHIVPICHRLGLLDANGGWLRERFGELGLLGSPRGLVEALASDETVSVVADALCIPVEQ